MLTAILIALLILLLIILWLLLTPVIIYADSDENLYYVKMRGVFTLSPVFRNEEFRLRVNVPFYTFYIDPTKEKAEKKKKKKEKFKEVEVKKESKGKMKWKDMSRFISSIWRTFKLRKLELNIDTGDFIRNAWLVPVFHFASRDKVRLTTNFNGDFDLKLDIQNRLIRFIPPITKLMLRSK